VSKPENRIEAIRPLIEAAGGKLIDAYYTLGDFDGIMITEFPADIDALTVSMGWFFWCNRGSQYYCSDSDRRCGEGGGKSRYSDWTISCAWPIATAICWMVCLGVARIKALQ